MIEHPAGREWREFRTVTLKWIGGIAIFSILALLTIFSICGGAACGSRLAARAPDPALQCIGGRCVG